MDTGVRFQNKMNNKQVTFPRNQHVFSCKYVSVSLLLPAEMALECRESCLNRAESGSAVTAVIV